MTVLFVIATIVFFLTLDWIYRRIKERKPDTAAFAPTATVAYPVRTPEGIFFTRTHTWLNLFPSGRVQLGIDDFIGRMLEKPRITYLKNIGDKVRKGDVLLMLEENEHFLTVQSPIEGTVLAHNDELPEHPELLKTMLFSDGWAYSIKPERFSEIKGLLLGHESHAWMREEFGRLRDFFTGVNTNQGNLALSPALLQDGGPPVAGAMKSMGPDVWRQFEQEFLSIEASERNVR